jgi:arylsulfatase A-like enzyme
MAFLDERGLTDSTMIVMCSDHGDYLGDHWLGEKELFHDASARVPLIVVDPDPAADASRGTVDNGLVQAIDLAPTFVAAAGGTPPDHILEGTSLLPRLRGGRPAGHTAIVSELDYSFRKAVNDLGVAPDLARAYMVRTERWKYVYFEGFRPQLFDMENDPQELADLGADPAFASVREEHREMLFDWSRRRKMRITIPNETVAARAGNHGAVIIGKW